MRYVSKCIPKQMRLQPLPENVITERRVSEVVTLLLLLFDLTFTNLQKTESNYYYYYYYLHSYKKYKHWKTINTTIHTLTMCRKRTKCKRKKKKKYYYYSTVTDERHSHSTQIPADCYKWSWPSGWRDSTQSASGSFVQIPSSHCARTPCVAPVMLQTASPHKPSCQPAQSYY